MPRFPLRTAFLLAAMLLLAGCGFQLRGAGTATALPESWRQMHLVTGNPNSEFSREVKARFAANGITGSTAKRPPTFCGWGRSVSASATSR